MAHRESHFKQQTSDKRTFQPWSKVDAALTNDFEEYNDTTNHRSFETKNSQIPAIIYYNVSWRQNKKEAELWKLAERGPKRKITDDLAEC